MNRVLIPFEELIRLRETQTPSPPFHHEGAKLLAVLDLVLSITLSPVAVRFTTSTFFIQSSCMFHSGLPLLYDQCKTLVLQTLTLASTHLHKESSHSAVNLSPRSTAVCSVCSGAPADRTLSPACCCWF